MIFFRLREDEITGQTLVEVLIAISVVLVIMSSITMAVISAINNATAGKNQVLATHYAQEGMEIVKQLQINNYKTFNSLAGRYCLAQSCATLATSVGSCGSNSNGNVANCSQNVNNNFFIRQIDILAAGSAQAKCVNTIQATVSVLWADGKCATGTFCHTEQVISCFSNANVIGTP